MYVMNMCNRDVGICQFTENGLILWIRLTSGRGFEFLEALMQIRIKI